MNDNYLKRFDQVKILTTKNVKYLSAPPGSEITPYGIWSIIAAVDKDVLLAKNSIIIRIPSTDVLKIMSYDLETMTKNFGRLSRGES